MKNKNYIMINYHVANVLVVLSILVVHLACRPNRAVQNYHPLIGVLVLVTSIKERINKTLMSETFVKNLMNQLPDVTHSCLEVVVNIGPEKHSCPGVVVNN